MSSVSVENVLVGLQTSADAGLAFPVTLGTAAGSPPYVVLDLMPGPGYGDELDPERFRTVYFQATAVGRDDRQAAWHLDKFRTWLLAHDGPTWTNAITAAGHVVYDRRSDALGPSDGDATLRQMAERFALEVEAL